MNISTVLVFFLCAVTTSIVLLITAYILTNYILLPYKHKSYHVPPEQLFNFLKLIIDNEITMFDRRMFGTKRAGISNSDYENYYKELCTIILNSLSEGYTYKMSFLLSEEHLASIVSTTVHEYLVTKIEK